MELCDKAKAYAQAQSETFGAAIEKAYIQGYNDAAKEHAKEFIKIVEDGVEYIDLGLPSGTLWALSNPSRLSYHEAQKINIPTKEQIEELIKYIRWEVVERQYSDEFIILDVYGHSYHKSVCYDQNSGMSRAEMYMWYRAELDDNGNAHTMNLYRNNRYCENSCFPGYHAYAFLVK